MRRSGERVDRDPRTVASIAATYRSGPEDRRVDRGNVSIGTRGPSRRSDRMVHRVARSIASIGGNAAIAPRGPLRRSGQGIDKNARTAYPIPAMHTSIRRDGVVPRLHERRGPTGSLERNRRDAAAEKERVEQKDQKIGKYEEDASEQVIGALIEVHRALGPSLLESAYEACLCHELQASAPLAAAPSTFLIFPIFLSPFLSPAAEACCALHASVPWNRGTRRVGL
jgi:hypothetical protein